MNIVNFFLSMFSKLVTCPICAWSGYKFLPNKRGNRNNARCPNCGSLERHRLQKLVMDKIAIMETIKDSKVLHFAPERFLTALFQDNAKYYLTADLQPKKAMIVADIRKTDFEDNSFNIVIASHVLEHLKQGDDLRAVREIHRILEPGGLAILPVPIHRKGKTIEYGYPKKDEHGHYRSPGTDYFKIFEQANFNVKIFSCYDFDYKKYGLLIDRDFIPVLTKLVDLG